ncbi:MAG: ABC transporter ATP-binding protein [Terriglobia bacterium]
MPNNDEAVRASHVTKSYGDTVAVDNLSLTLKQGESLGLLGPNGAGKTTLVRMIHCFFPPTAGTIEVFGLDVRRSQRKIKARLGVIPQVENFDPDLPVLENLTVYARYFDLKKKVAKARAEELLRFLELEDKAENNLDELSAGMKRRLLIVRGLINEPDLLVLDEPTVGLDPQVRLLIWDKLDELKARGVTQIITTHYMDEAARLCDRVAIMDKGHILASGTPGQLVESVGTDVVEVKDDGATPDQVRTSLETGGYDIEKAGSTIFIYGNDGKEVVGQLLATGYRELTTRPATLEDVFLKTTGRAITS